MSTTPAGKPAAQAYRPAGDDVVRFLQENATWGRTIRYRQLDRYEAHYRGRQYDHQQYDWWGRPAAATETISPEAVLPEGFTNFAPVDDLEARQKRPTAPRNLAKTIVKRFTGLLLSNQRRPRVVVENDPDTEAFLEAVRESSKFWSAMRDARNKGGAVGAVCMTVHLRDGAFSYEVHNAKDVQVIWKDRRTWTPQGILKMYEYPVEEDVRDEKTKKVVGTRQVSYLYRRIITDTVDIVYKPVRLEAEEPTWEPDDGLSVQHDLGYFPGVWIQNEAESDDMDGEPDCDEAWNTLDTGDRLLAQMNQGTLMNLDPTAALAYDPKEVLANGGLQKGSGHSLHLGKGGTAAYMEINGSGIEIGLRLLKVLKQDVLDLTRCVLLDPEQISGSAQSAKAIEYIFSPMLERADDFRDQYGSGIVHLMRITEKMARAFKPMDLGLDADGARRIGRPEFDLPMRKVKTDDGGEELVSQKLGTGGGYVLLEWGPYFSPSAEDNSKKIANAVAANAGGLVDVETAASSVADIFQVRDVAGVVKRAKDELEERAAAAMGMGFGGGVSENDPLAAPREERDPPAGAGGKP